MALPTTPTDAPTLTATASPRPRATDTSSLTSTVTPQPFVAVIQPADNGILSCDNQVEDDFCLFHIRGMTGGVDSFISYSLYVFVFPVNPPGAGWYLQKSPAMIASSGDWEQSPSFLGNTTFPAEKGNTLQVRAVLVGIDATVNGRKLSEMATSNEVIVLSAVQDIEGLVAISDVIDLTLDR